MRTSNDEFIDKIKKSYVAFAGCDLTASFNGIPIGSLQAITYNITREKAPVYTFGSPEPRTFVRNKRGIAGTLVFSQFNKDELICAFREKYKDDERAKIQKFKANDYINSSNDAYMSIDKWNKIMRDNVSGGIDENKRIGNVTDLVTKTMPYYGDELLPFDITITLSNEYGNQSMLDIYGVELLNESGGFSMDNVESQKAYTYIARRINPMRPVNEVTPEGLSAVF